MGIFPEVLCGKKQRKKSRSYVPLPFFGVPNNFKFNTPGTKHKNFGFKEAA